MMKHLLLILLAAGLIVLLTACGTDDTPALTAAPTEPPTQLHTVAPPRQSEAEWAHVYAAMTLEDADNIYAQGSDFVSFALIGTGDDAVIRFKLDEITAKMLQEQDPDNAYYVTMDDKRLGDVTLNEECDELTLIIDYSYDKLCELANQIRGL